MGENGDTTEVEYLKEIIELQKNLIKKSDEATKACSEVVDNYEEEAEITSKILADIKIQLSQETRNNFKVLRTYKVQIDAIDDSLWEIFQTLATSTPEQLHKGSQ